MWLLSNEDGDLNMIFYFLLVFFFKFLPLYSFLFQSSWLLLTFPCYSPFVCGFTFSLDWLWLFILPLRHALAAPSVNPPKIIMWQTHYCLCKKDILPQDLIEEVDNRPKINTKWCFSPAPKNVKFFYQQNAEKMIPNNSVQLIFLWS